MFMYKSVPTDVFYSSRVFNSGVNHGLGSRKLQTGSETQRQTGTLTTLREATCSVSCRVLKEGAAAASVFGRSSKTHDM